MRPAKRRTEKRPQRVPTLDDKWLKEIRAACAREMIAWLKGTINTQRAIRSLSMAEMECLAACATDRWIVLAASRLNETDDEAERADLLGILM